MVLVVFIYLSVMGRADARPLIGSLMPGMVAKVVLCLGHPKIKAKQMQTAE